MLTIRAVDNFTKNKKAEIICSMQNDFKCFEYIECLLVNFFISKITKYVDIFLEEKDNTNHKI